MSLLPIVNVVLCGGSGTRLWPVSRTKFPKQFVPLLNKKSLFQLTLERNSKLCERFCIVSNTEQYFLAMDQLGILASETPIDFILEPVGKNTAPAIAFACFCLEPDSIVLVTPSDHVILNEEAYQNVVQSAYKLAQDNFLVTFGIEPQYPETGYGYIQAKKGENENTLVMDVAMFHEKPAPEKAQEYLAINKKNGATRFMWNSGMFMFKAKTYLDELKKYAPEIYEKSKQAIDTKISNKTITRIEKNAMEAIPGNSIDYAVMEKSKIVKVVNSDISWSDLGSFDSLYDILEKDNQGNTIASEYINIDSKNNLILGNNRLISTIDIDNLFIVDTADALLIGKRGESQKVKHVVEKLNNEKLPVKDIHQTVYRPWGSYTVFESEPGYKIKKIIVKPGERLSLQKHYHRNEH